MSVSNQAPMDMWRANQELQASMTRLAQEAAGGWLGLGERLAAERRMRYEQLCATLHEERDWQGLMAWPAGLYLTHLRHDLGDRQDALRVALGLQTALAAGMQEALLAWQGAVGAMRPPHMAAPGAAFWGVADGASQDGR